MECYTGTTWETTLHPRYKEGSFTTLTKLVVSYLLRTSTTSMCHTLGFYVGSYVFGLMFMILLDSETAVVVNSTT